MKWYRPVAESGDAYAQYMMGFMCEQGKNVPHKPDEAVKWFSLAANQGDLSSQIRLAWMFYEGSGITKDLVLSYMWSNLAATASKGEEREQLENLRNYIATVLSPDELKLAQKKTREWKPASQPN